MVFSEAPDQVPSCSLFIFIRCATKASKVLVLEQNSWRLRSTFFTQMNSEEVKRKSTSHHLLLPVPAGESVHCELCSGARGAEKVIAVIFIVTRFNNKDEWPEIKASEDVWSPKQYATLLLSKLFEETGNRILELLFPLILMCCRQISRMFYDTKWYLLASLSANYSVTSITSCHHDGSCYYLISIS